MKKLFFTGVCLAFTLLSYAADNNFIKHEYDFSVVKSVRVGHFPSVPNKVQVDVDDGTVRAAFIRGLLTNRVQVDVDDGIVRAAFIRGLLTKGYDVVSDANVKVDAVIEGVIESSSRIVRRETKVKGYVFYHYPDSYVYNPYGIDHSGRYDQYQHYDRDRRRECSYYVVYDRYCTIVAIGISAYMTDIKTGQIVWSNSCSEEDQDIDSTVNKVVRDVLISLPKQ